MDKRDLLVEILELVELVKLVEMVEIVEKVEMVCRFPKPKISTQDTKYVIKVKVSVSL